MIKKKPPFWIGIIVWKDIQDRAFRIPVMKEQIDLKINLLKYGEGITTINFIPIAVLPSNRIHKEKITYSPRYKVLNLHLKLDYDEVVAAGVDGFLPMVGQLLLEGIDRAPQGRVKNFDWARFKQDISDLLAENGWLLSAVA